ncbi:MAG TPA: CoA transferase, partial [Terrimesophilobacter sp.]|nr:CoA transferase [Terrimesophilobacter sp.]
MQETSETDTRGPLDGYLVVDLSRALAGPHAGMMLADLGARVIKVEQPSGDDTRSWGPPFVGPEDDRQSTYFLSCNRNKESIALDLKSDDGKEVLRGLVERADILLENFRPGVLDRLGFSTAAMHELNPGLVILSITGFGHDGPESSRSGYDQILQGEAGLMSLTGSGPDDPERVGVPIADLLSGIYGAFGALAALL